jgi:hypothetical protein
LYASARRRAQWVDLADADVAQLAWTEVAIALSRGREMIGKMFSSFWPALARMPSGPGCQPASVSSCLAFSGSNV